MQGVQYGSAAQSVGLPAARSEGDSVRQMVAQAARAAGTGTWAPPPETWSSRTLNQELRFGPDRGPVGGEGD